MSRLHAVALAALALLGTASGPRAGAEQETRTFRFTYRVEIGPIAKGDGPVDIFVPVAQDQDAQRVLSFDVKASVPGVIGREEKHGNRFWHAHVAESDGTPIVFRAEYVIRREVLRVAWPARSGSRSPNRRERAARASWLLPDARVPVDDPVLEPILAEIRMAAGSPEKRRIARAIFDWVVDNMEYQKVGTGWGHGDTYWACSSRYGNCTDFHSLFDSLARSEGIPARFEMGFPVPLDKEAGEVSGYHCWTSFFLRDAGWVPVDASEAAKERARRDGYYGVLPADRVHFTNGRDLELGQGHATGPLNYFVYPHVEVDGEPFAGPIMKSFSYGDAQGEQRRAEGSSRAGSGG